jgi:flagellar hook protein FlgE
LTIILPVLTSPTLGIFATAGVSGVNAESLALQPEINATTNANTTNFKILLIILTFKYTFSEDKKRLEDIHI